MRKNYEAKKLKMDENEIKAKSAMKRKRIRKQVDTVKKTKQNWDVNQETNTEISGGEMKNKKFISNRRMYKWDDF